MHHYLWPRTGRRRIVFPAQVLFLLAWLVTCITPLYAAASSFNGAAALAYTSRATAFGERPPGSPALERLRTWIISELKPLPGEVILDPFQAQTPDGLLPMTNIIFKLPGSSGKSIAVTGHYDTLHIPMVHFVGANDAGSSTGFLLELARVASRMKHVDEINIVFFDGEEAIRQWTQADSLYGSRHLVAKWGSDGTLSRTKAVINIDMIGDKDLAIMNDENSAQSLRDLMWQVAESIADGKYFERGRNGVDDDHMPFVQAGVNALDIIDFNYGPNNSYWHTAQDTTDKLSAHSFQVIGDVVTGMLERLERS